MYEIVCNEVKPIQVSRSCVVMFIPLSHAGQTCVECCKDIRVLLYSDGQNRAYFLAYRHRWSNVIHTYQVGNIIQQLFLIYRHTERMCVEYLIYWLNKLKWPHILNSRYVGVLKVHTLKQHETEAGRPLKLFCAAAVQHLPYYVRPLHQPRDIAGGEPVAFDRGLG